SDGLPLSAMTVGEFGLFGGVLALSALVAGQNPLGDEARVLPDRGLDLGGNVGIGLEKRLGILAALADSLAVVGEPGAWFLPHGPPSPKDRSARPSLRRPRRT